MHTSNVKVLRGPITFWGWKSRLILNGDTVTLDGFDGGQSMVLNLADVRRASFNSSNGLWALRLNDGRRFWLQSADGRITGDRTAAGETTNRLIAERLIKHGARVFGV